MNLPSDHRPTPDQLALIAAQLLAAYGGNVARAVSDAARLWEASAAEVQAWGKRTGTDPSASTDLLALRADAAELDSKPAMSFDQMLGRLMSNAKTEDKLASFRHYLTAATKSDGGDLLASWRTKEIREWELEAITESFLEWRRTEILKARSEAGKKGNAARNEKSL